MSWKPSLTELIFGFYFVSITLEVILSRMALIKARYEARDTLAAFGMTIGNVLTNLMMAEADVEAAVLELERSLASSSARIWLISNEVGMGIVPENALARRFRDEAGRLHQRLAAICDHVTLVAAGLPLSFE